jgi:hypothetical protein
MNNKGDLAAAICSAHSPWSLPARGAAFDQASPGYRVDQMVRPQHVVLCLCRRSGSQGRSALRLANLRDALPPAQANPAYGVGSVSGAIGGALRCCRCSPASTGWGRAPAPPPSSTGGDQCLAIILTAKVLGALGVARAVSAILFSIVIGADGVVFVTTTAA